MKIIAPDIHELVLLYLEANNIRYAVIIYENASESKKRRKFCINLFSDKFHEDFADYWFKPFIAICCDSDDHAQHIYNLFPHPENPVYAELWIDYKLEDENT